MNPSHDVSFRLTGLMLALVLGLLLVDNALVVAQVDDQAIFLPLVASASNAQEQGSPNLANTLSFSLPDPTPVAHGDPDPAAQDPDGDGVLTLQDTCPTLPNPPAQGTQPLICGRALAGLIDRLVFLKSRSFAPSAGLEPALQQTENRARVHALLHVRGNDNGVVLRPDQRQRLEEAGVVLLDYLPHKSYYVSVPRDRTQLAAIAALDMVHGVSAIRPRDRVAPQVRVRGPYNGRNADGTLSIQVDFFADVPTSEIEPFLSANAKAFTLQYDSTYSVTVASWPQIRLFANQDIVQWIDDLEDEPQNFTQNAQQVAAVLPVSQNYGYRGAGLVLAMEEIDLFDPLSHPDMIGRVFHGNSPLFESNDPPDHPQMVASIMIANETSFPSRAGFLPEASLYSYSIVGHTVKQEYFKIPRDAREDHGALLINNSWGRVNCTKAGEYTRHGKFRDRAVVEAGIVIVDSAGNTRGPNGDFATETPTWNCAPDLFSLHHPTAKNDIAVGNWCLDNVGNCAAPDTLSGTSAAGPTADLRLKPDVVAPGDGIQTLDWDEVSLTVIPYRGSGTSAAAPATAGVIGMIAEVFTRQGLSVNDLPPARLKAILLHTAKDVGLPGPDFMHGYGLIQAAPAVRIAQEWSQWGHEGTLDNSTTELTIPFTVDSPIFSYKATMAWDDKEGDYRSYLALKNDLDLVLVSPSGAEFRPYDLTFPLGSGITPAVPCTSLGCQDRLNNVEQVLVQMPNGAALERGNWEARVSFHRLVSDEQAFSLVLTPPCPIIIDHNVTLSESLTCAGSPLQPAAVEINTAGVALNCNNFVITGTVATANAVDEYSGILITGDNATVRNCKIGGFDIGVAIGNDREKPDRAQILHSEFQRMTTAAVRAWGDNHLIEANKISAMTTITGVGVSVLGAGIHLIDNDFYTALAGGGVSQNTAIDITPGSSTGEVERNRMSGGWQKGIYLHSLSEARSVHTFDILDNEFEGIRESPIHLQGMVTNTVVSGNLLRAYGAASSGILINAVGDMRPYLHTVENNTIMGAESVNQTGIELIGTLTVTVRNNPLIQGVGVGISEQNAVGSRIAGNAITNQAGANPFFTTVGIRSTNSSGVVSNGVLVSHIDNNTVRLTQTGISITGIGQQRATGNGLNVRVGGILVFNTAAPQVNGNVITLNNGGIGITVSKADFAQVSGNQVNTPSSGISIADTISVTVASNTIDNPTTVGIHIYAGNNAQLTGNQVTNNGATGIHYASGADAQIRENEITSLFGANIVGIRAGNSNLPPCDQVVSNLRIENNTLNGGGLDYEVFCDAPGTIILP